MSSALDTELPTDLASSHWVHSLYLDYFLVLYLHACCIIVTRWGEHG